MRSTAGSRSCASAHASAAARCRAGSRRCWRSPAPSSTARAASARRAERRRAAHHRAGDRRFHRRTSSQTRADRRAARRAEYRPHADRRAPRLCHGQGAGRGHPRRATSCSRTRESVGVPRRLTGRQKHDDWLSTLPTWPKGAWRKGKPGATHQLTEAKQGKYHYVYGPYAEPVLRIKPGDIVVAETQDAFEGEIKVESDKPTESSHARSSIRNAGRSRSRARRRATCSAVHIHSIKPRGPQPVGTTALIPEFGGLVATANTAMLNEPLPERVKKMEVTENGIKFNARITLPYEPFIGTLGVIAGDRGGDLSAAGLLGRQHGPAGCRTRRRSSIFRSITRTPISISAIATPPRAMASYAASPSRSRSTTTVQVDLIKGWTIAWPRLENERLHHDHRQRRPMEDAARIAYRELDPLAGRTTTAGTSSRPISY